MVVPMEQWASQPFQDKSADLWAVMLSDQNEKYSDRMERSYKAFAVTFELRFPFPLRINVIQFWAPIVAMISMIKWQCHSCYCYHYCYYHHFLLLLFSWCAVLMNTPGLCDSFVMRVLSDFYWTAATGAGLFTSQTKVPFWDGLLCLRQTAQRNSVMLSTACRRHVHSAENEFRWQEYRSAINQIREISLMQWPEPAW